ncbi:MAG: hypothetical protein AABZ06_01020 [Bdellovibrionota bacterium]
MSPTPSPTISPTPSPTSTQSAAEIITPVSTGNFFTCRILANGSIKCWGQNNHGQLGLGDKENRGDSSGEMGQNLPEVPLGTGHTATAISAGLDHVCAILEDGSVKCWGQNNHGQLGLGDKENRGDIPGEMGNALPSIDLGSGRKAIAVALGAEHSCALLDNGTVKCWGRNNDGQLGLGDSKSRGDKPAEMGDNLPAVNLGTGRTARSLSAGKNFTCAVLDNDTVKCWGYNNYGQLGQGGSKTLGDSANEMGDNLSTISLGSGRTARSVSAGESFACALLDNYEIKCWGRNNYGQLGIGNKSAIGDKAGQMGDDLQRVELGTAHTATSVVSGAYHTCAILNNGDTKCWGRNTFGQLGLGDTATRGDKTGDMGDSLGAVSIGASRSARFIDIDETHSCAVLDDGTTKCWGKNNNGQLGQGNTLLLGDSPTEMGDNLAPVQLQ